MCIFKDIKDPAVKWAVKLGHDSRCFLCNKETPIGDVDHYIPKFLKNKTNEFNKIKKELQLPKEFSIDYIDSYHNLVWCCKPCNQILKRNKIPDPEEWRSRYYYLIKRLIKKKEELEVSFKIINEREKIIPLLEKSENLISLLEIREDISIKISKLSQDFVEKLNQTIQTKFPIIKERFFKNNKVGIALSVYGDNIAYFTYPNSQKDNFIEANMESYRKLNSQATSPLCSRKKTLLYNTDKFIDDIIRNYIDYIFNHKMLKHHDEKLATEGLFYYIDKWYNVLFKKHDDPEMPDTFELKELKKAFLELNPNYKNTYTSFNYHHIGGDICLNIFYEMIEHLEEKEVRTIIRPYRKGDKSLINGKERYFICDVYDDEDLEANLRFIFSNIKKSYQNIIAVNFPFLITEELPEQLIGEYLIHIFESKQQNNHERIEYFRFRNTNTDNFTYVKHQNIKSLPKPWRIIYEGKEHEIDATGYLDCPFGSALTSMVYTLLFNKIKETLDIKDDFFFPSISFQWNNNFW